MIADTLASSKGEACGIILMYHRIVNTNSDPWDLCVSPKHFKEQMNVLLSGEYQCCALKNMLAPAKSDEKRTRVAITFDDGYADNIYNALPILEKRKIPATVFVISDAVGKGKEFWWDHLGRLILQSGQLPANLKISICGNILSWDLSLGKEKIYRAAWESISQLDPRKRDEAIVQLENQIRKNEPASPNSLPVTEEQLKGLSRSPIIEIGGHTISHPFLARLPKEEQRKEIAECKNRLESIINMDVSSFSCPHGSYDDSTMAILRESGFHRACTSRNENVGKNVDPFLLPRRVVVDWNGEEFKRNLNEWLTS